MSTVATPASRVTIMSWRPRVPYEKSGEAMQVILQIQHLKFVVGASTGDGGVVQVLKPVYRESVTVL